MVALLDSLAAEFRITARLMLETFGGLKRSGWMNMVIVVTMASILTIFGSLSVVVLDSQQFLKSLGSSMQISVYLKDNVRPIDVRTELVKLTAVRKTRLITKEEALREMQTIYKDLPEVGNPLPDTFRVYVQSPEQIVPTAERIRSLAGVEKVNYPYRITQKIRAVTQAVTVFGYGITLLLGLLTAFIISNTLSLLIQARGREIEILRMMGVGNWYIRLPFLLQGAFYGLLSAGLAYLPVAAVHQVTGDAFSFLQITTAGATLPFVLGIMLLLGITVGASGAAVSMHKYLKI